MSDLAQDVAAAVRGDAAGAAEAIPVAQIQPAAMQAQAGNRKRKMTIAIAYILISVSMGALGQIILKQGMLNTGQITLSASDIFHTLWRLATNPYVVIGLGLYAAGTVFWLAALSRVDLSYAYPFASLSYVVMLLASWRLFEENISPMRLLGTLVIGLGVFLISRT